MALNIRSCVKFRLESKRRSKSQCQPCNDASGSCIGYAHNYSPVCQSFSYVPFGVRWYQEDSDWTLTTNANGSVTLSNLPVVPGPDQMQITLPNLNYTVNLKPSVCDLFALSGVPTLPGTDQQLFNTLYIVTDIDDLANTWTLEPLRVADSCIGDFIQIEHYRSPFSDNQRRVVQLVNVVCPWDTWEWRDTQIKQLVNAIQIFIRCILIPKRCGCRVKSTRCTQVGCMRRKLEWSTKSNRGKFNDDDHDDDAERRQRAYRSSQIKLKVAPRKMLTGFLHKIPSTRLHLRRSIHEANLNLAPEPKSVDERLVQTMADRFGNMTMVYNDQDYHGRSAPRFDNGIFDGQFFS